MGHNELGDLFYAQGDLQVGAVGAAPAVLHPHGHSEHPHGAQQAGGNCTSPSGRPAGVLRMLQASASLAAAPMLMQHGAITAESCALPHSATVLPAVERVQALHAHARLLHHRPPRDPHVPARWVGGWAAHTCVWWYSFVCLGAEHMFGCWGVSMAAARHGAAHLARHMRLPAGHNRMRSSCARQLYAPLSLRSLTPHCTRCCAAVVKCSIELGNYIHLSNYVQKAENTPEAQVGWPCSLDACRPAVPAVCKHLGSIHAMHTHIITRGAGEHRCCCEAHGGCVCAHASALRLPCTSVEGPSCGSAMDARHAANCPRLQGDPAVLAKLACASGLCD